MTTPLMGQVVPAVGVGVHGLIGTTKGVMMATETEDKQQPEAPRPRPRRPLAVRLAEMQAQILRGAAEVLEMRDMEMVPAQLAKDHLIGAEQSLSRAVAPIPAETE